MAEDPDPVFRYPIEARRNSGERDPLREMIRRQIENLLDLLSLTHEGKEVKVDGFRLMNEREAIHPLFPMKPAALEVPAEPPATVPPPSRATTPTQSIRNAELYEPRIPYIRDTIESLLSVVALESDGKMIEVDGFRLKDLRDWQVPSAGDPAEVLDHLATRCDCHCAFCYLRGNPPSLALEQPPRTSEEEMEEARTRLKYFSPSRKRALFPALGSSYEILAHPYAPELLAEVRKKTDRPIRLSTNGNHLTVPLIRTLSSLQPVYLYLSLNSSSTLRRSRIMGVRDSATAIEALPLLREMGIPYAVVIVPWPFPSIAEMLADLRRTVAYADRHDAHLVEVSLPGASRYFSPSPLFDLEEVWSAVAATVRSLPAEVRTPLLIKPSLYEETRHGGRFNLPGILGVVKNSPAADAGLLPADLILAVGGLRVSSRPQARDLLRLHHQRGSSAVPLSIQRAQETLACTIFPDRFRYPYAPPTDHHLGIIFMGAGLRPSALETLHALILAHEASNVLFMSSHLVKPVFQQLLQESPLFADRQIHIEVPQNQTFGGNIFMGDLLVARDFIGAIRAYLENNPPPDLIVIPSSPFSLGQWRRDLEGRPYTDIERAVGLPVALLDVEPIWD